MREILFRGKRTDNGEWVYGHYTKKEVGEFICGKFQKRFISVMILNFSDGGFQYCEVISETVGQYTGLTGKNGTKIFEGDNIRYKTTFLTAIVFYEEGAFQVVFGGMHQHDLKDLDLRYVEVIGNIHERKHYENK